MQLGDLMGLMARSHKGLVLFVAALFVFSIALFATSAVAPRNALAAAGDPVVTLQDDTNGCNGVLPTPGSENTNKRLDRWRPGPGRVGDLRDLLSRSTPTTWRPHDVRDHRLRLHRRRWPR